MKYINQVSILIFTIFNEDVFCGMPVIISIYISDHTWLHWL